MLREASRNGGNGETVQTGQIESPARLAESSDPQMVGDLRRRIRGEQMGKILDRATVLAAPDRLLLEAVFRDGRTAVQVASLTGQPVRCVRRRVKRLVKRLVSPEFVFIVQHREKWPGTRRRIADACVIEGRSMQQAAKHLRLSFHSVRRHMEVIAGFFEAAVPGKRWSAPTGFRVPLVGSAPAPARTGGAS